VAFDFDRDDWVTVFYPGKHFAPEFAGEGGLVNVFGYW
jgi:hypothetical protein